VELTSDRARGSSPGPTTSIMGPWTLIAFFVISLQQFSIDVGGNGITANYVYALFPFFCWFGILQRRVLRRRQLVDIVIVYCLIYLFGIPGDFAELSAYVDSPVRRLASFIVFMLPLFLSLVEFTPADVRLFKMSVVLASLLYSANSIIALGANVGSVGLFQLKGAVGSQRYGFVLCLGFFLSLFSDALPLKRWMFPQRVVACSLIAFGVVLTFSRASIVALVGGGVFVLGNNVYRYIRGDMGARTVKSGTRKLRPAHIGIALTFVVVAFVCIQRYFGVNLLDFYQARIDELAGAGSLAAAVSNSESSEGYRYYLLRLILAYVAAHPLIGSSYRGLYLLFDEFRDGVSSHNQYTDVLLRTGLIGTLVWCFLIYRIVRFCQDDKGLLAGILSILIYGAFHETFKLSQGSFILGMLLSFSYMTSPTQRGDPPANLPHADGPRD
jgi:O-antigen ligase